jgi:hypothetical protein
MKVEAAEIEIQPDPRRRRLLFVVPSGLAIASPLALIACGGGSNGSDPGGSGVADPDQAKAEAIAATLPALSRSVQAAKVMLPAASPPD